MVNLSNYINKRVKISPKSTKFSFNENILDSINHDNIIFLKHSDNININHLIRIVNPHLEWQYILNGIVIKGKVHFKDQFIGLLGNIRIVSDVYSFICSNMNEILVMTEGST
jgi:hypothetical protein